VCELASDLQQQQPIMPRQYRNPDFATCTPIMEMGLAGWLDIAVAERTDFEHVLDEQV